MALLPALPVRADWRGRCPEAAEEEARRSRARLRSTVPAPTWRASYASCGWSLRVRRDRTAPATAAVSRDPPARAKRAGLDQGAFCLDPQAQGRAQRAGQVRQSRLEGGFEAAIQDGQGGGDTGEDRNRCWRGQALRYGRRSGGRATQLVARAARGTAGDLRTWRAGTTRIATPIGSRSVAGRCQYGRSECSDEHPGGRQRCEQLSHRPGILRAHLLRRKQNAQARGQRNRDSAPGVRTA